MPATTRSASTLKSNAAAETEVEQKEGVATAGVARARSVAQDVDEEPAIPRVSSAPGCAVEQNESAIDASPDQRMHSGGAPHPLSPEQLAHLHQLLESANLDSNQLITFQSVLAQAGASSSSSLPAVATSLNRTNEDGDTAAHEVGRLPERRQPEGAAATRVGTDRDGLQVRTPIDSSSASAVGDGGGSLRRGITDVDAERALRTAEGTKILSSLGQALERVFRRSAPRSVGIETDGRANDDSSLADEGEDRQSESGNEGDTEDGTDEDGEEDDQSGDDHLHGGDADEHGCLKDGSGGDHGRDDDVAAVQAEAMKLREECERNKDAANRMQQALLDMQDMFKSLQGELQAVRSSQSVKSDRTEVEVDLGAKSKRGVEVVDTPVETCRALFSGGSALSAGTAKALTEQNTVKSQREWLSHQMELCGVQQMSVAEVVKLIGNNKITIGVDRAKNEKAMKRWCQLLEKVSGVSDKSTHP